jgi:hypothetical protein
VIELARQLVNKSDSCYLNPKLRNFVQVNLTPGTILACGVL